jgi:hypothetical protein
MRKLRPTPAGVIACLALAIALGGTAFAATTLVPKNSVGSAQVINGSLRTLDLSKATRSALRGRPGPVGARGAQGVQGIQGLKGEKGEKGDTGPSNVYGATFCTTGMPGCPAGSPPPKELTASTYDATDFFVTLAIPAGAYSVQGIVTVVAPPDGDPDPSNDPDWRVECLLRAPLTGPGYAGGASATVGAYSGEASETTLPIVFAGNLPNGGPLGLKCRRGAGSGADGTGSSNPKVVYVELSAIRAGSFG